MSPHHSDQMSQRSQVSRVALCMSKVKVLSVSESVTRSPIELFWTAKNVSNFQETVISLSLFLPPISLIWWQSFVTLEITLSVDLAIMKWIAGKENTIAVWFKCNE